MNDSRTSSLTAHCPATDCLASRGTLQIANFAQAVDTRDEVVWRATGGTRALAVWKWTTNTRYFTEYSISPPAAVQPPPDTDTTGWDVSEIGDFTGDGDADILWRRTAVVPSATYEPTSYELKIWQIQGEWHYSTERVTSFPQSSTWKQLGAPVTPGTALPTNWAPWPEVRRSSLLK